MGIRSTTPVMATLLRKAWKAKAQRIKAMNEKSTTSPQTILRPTRKKARVVANKPMTYSPLLSRRIGRRVLMIVLVPPRPDFPPPLVWEPLDLPSPTPPEAQHPAQPLPRLRPRPLKQPPPRPRQSKRAGRSINDHLK